MRTRLIARFDDDGVKKITQIKAATGLTVSQILRQLVAVAEVEPIQARLSNNADGDRTSKGDPVAI